MSRNRDRSAALLMAEQCHSRFEPLIMIVFALWQHFSSYRICVRAMVADGITQRTAEGACNRLH
jgi:hypothetical protein